MSLLYCLGLYCRIWITFGLGNAILPIPTLKSLKVNNNKEVLIKNILIYVFALQDQYPEVTHGKKYLCSGCKHEISLFFVLMDMPVMFSLIMFILYPYYISSELCFEDGKQPKTFGLNILIFLTF